MGKGRRTAAVFVIAGLVAVCLVATGAVQTQPGSGQSYTELVTVTSSTCVRPSGFILIMADLSGYNDSIAHGAPLNPWPVVRVKLGDVVRFLVCNDDPTQPHGFAIQTYFNRGVAIMPGEAYRIEFTATLTGTFVLYCNIFCTVHIFMVGRLIVAG